MADEIIADDARVREMLDTAIKNDQPFLVVVAEKKEKHAVISTCYTCEDDLPMLLSPLRSIMSGDINTDVPESPHGPN